MQHPLSRNNTLLWPDTSRVSGSECRMFSDLFAARYGQDSSIAELAVKALVSSMSLEHELTIIDAEKEPASDSTVKGFSASAY